ncbi:arginine ABC transporter permease [Alphaproteobacteria bacterium]|nr:arginine ABC transporter permease [Alphaproteobacteria bacterium]
MERIVSDIVYVGTGVLVTLQLLVGAICIGIVGGLLMSILRYRGTCRSLINGMVSIIRGTPLILQLGLIYFAVPGIFGIKLTAIAAGIISFGLNSSAYVAEILRAGIESIPKGQFEAAQTLGIPTSHMWKDIILPQVVRNVLPAMVGEIIALLKETAIISMIGCQDIMRKSQLLAAEQFVYFTPLCIAGVYYYLLVLFIEFIGRKIERSEKYDKSI